MREIDKSMAKWERQTKVWPNERDRQKYGQMREIDKSMAKWERQTKVWQNERDRQKYGQMRETDKSMAKWERQTKVWPNGKGQKDKQRTSKYNIENYKVINKILTKSWGWTQVLREGRQFLFH